MGMLHEMENELDVSPEAESANGTLGYLDETDSITSGNDQSEIMLFLLKARARKVYVVVATRCGAAWNRASEG